MCSASSLFVLVSSFLDAFAFWTYITQAAGLWWWNCRIIWKCSSPFLGGKGESGKTGRRFTPPSRLRRGQLLGR